VQAFVRFVTFAASPDDDEAIVHFGGAKTVAAALCLASLAAVGHPVRLELPTTDSGSASMSRPAPNDPT
jgi:hypothetical protein